ncbi:MAG: S1 family peptidase [Opitutaceae bacterium]
MRSSAKNILAAVLVLFVLFSSSGFSQGTVFGYTKETAQETLEERVVRLKKELAEAELALAVSINAEEVEEVVAQIEEPPPQEVVIPSGALVVIEGENGSGSGFIANMKGRPFLISNIHVMGAARGARITTVDGEKLRLGSTAYVSKGRDIAIIPITWAGPTLELSASLNFDKVAIGDGVIVMGNSSGASVATRLKGVVKGLGPKEVEVSAKFVPGNSGSPIVHQELGTVIAVASHLKDFSSDSKWTQGTGLNRIRRFGYRLDGDIIWEQIELSDLYKQGEAYGRFEDRTIAMWNISYQLSRESILLTSYRDHPSIGYIYEGITNDFDVERNTSSAHNILLLRRFIASMINETQNDLVNTDDVITLSFYQNRFDEIKVFRGKIRNNLNRFADSRL